MKLRINFDKNTVTGYFFGGGDLTTKNEFRQ